MAGDVNDDGYDDFVLPASYYEDGDQVDGIFSFLFLGRPELWGQAWDYFECDASFQASGGATVGDVNGDGQLDLAFATDGEDDVDRVHLFLHDPWMLGMGTTMDFADASYVGEAPDYAAGRAKGRGDVNGDGFDDLVFRSPHSHEAATNAGQVYLLLGRSVGWSQDMPVAGADASWLGEEGGDNAGWNAALAGDLNGDGYDDILIGAPGHTGIVHDVGQVYLVLGEPHALCPGDPDSDGYGNPGHVDCPNGEETDCDDADPWINPGVDDICDGIDNNCNGEIDEADGDGDGYLLCEDDCDDGNANIFPGTDEICDDGLDNDCDGLVDVADEECDEGDDDSADDDTPDDGTGDPGDGDCQCRGDSGPAAGPFAAAVMALLLLTGLRRSRY